MEMLASAENESMENHNPTCLEETPAAKTKSLDLNSHEMFPCLSSVKRSRTPRQTGLGLIFALDEAEGGSEPSKLVWSTRPADAVVRHSHVITQVFQMPVEHQRRRNPSDRRGLAEICATVGKDTGTTIEASRSGQTMAYTFVIKGAENDIPVARRRLWSQLAESVTVALDVPEDCLGLVIGPSGKKVQALIAETFTNIKIPRPYQGQVYVTGDFEGIALAKQRIEELIHQKASRASSSISIERHLLPFVLGCSPAIKGAAIINEFADKHGVKVQYGGSREAETVSLMISGERVQVASAIALLEDRVKAARRHVKSISTKVPKTLHRLLIGPKGDCLHALEEETGCFIQVPLADDPSDSITVYGPESSLLKGLQAIIDRTGSFDSQKIAASTTTRCFLIHGGANLVRELEQKYAVHISATDSGLVIDGKRAEVAISAMELQNTISRLNSQHFESLEVGSSLLKHVIGKNHRNIEQIKNDFGVEVVVNNGSILLTSGDQAACIAAREHLQRQLREIANMASAEVRIDRKFYPQLIGPKGCKINALREQHPAVMVDFLEETVAIRGPLQDVEQVRAELVKRADALKHEAVMRSYTVELECSAELLEVATDKSGELTRLVQNAARKSNVKLALTTRPRTISITGLKSDADAFKTTLGELLTKIADCGTETIEIEPAYHGALIGRNGKNVKHLQQKYNVRLSFPEADDRENPSVTLTGPRANLKAAIDEVREFVEYQKAHSEMETLRVPREYVAAIVGRAGAVISEISSETECRIDFDKEADETGQVTVRIEGSSSGIQKALDRINDILAVKTETIKIERSQADLLLQGAGSVWYQKLVADAEARGVAINLYRTSGTIVLRGEAGLVDEVRTRLEALLAEEYVVEEITIPLKFHGEIIGQRGENVKRLSATHNVVILLPNSSRQGSSKSPETVLVEGRPVDVAAARQELLTYVREVKSVAVPRTVRASLLEELATDLAALHVQAADNQREGIRLSGGDKDQIDAAAQLIADYLAKADFCTERVNIPQTRHRMIIGKGGAEIERLRKETGCRIAVPPVYKTSDVVELSGTADAVAKAKEAILKIVDSSP